MVNLIRGMLPQLPTKESDSMIWRSAVLAVLLVGCNNWHGTGTVIQKSSKTTSTCVPTSSTQPERWTLKIRDHAGDTHSVSVSEGEYNGAKVGDAFTNGE
jgi:uncharacterized lipoprotein NlpE involved in copper resistance